MQFEEFDQIETMLSFHRTADNMNLIQGKVLCIYNSIGSELRIFLKNLIETQKFARIDVNLEKTIDPKKKLDKVTTSQIMSDFVKILDFFPKKHESTEKSTNSAESLDNDTTVDQEKEDSDQEITKNQPNGNGEDSSAVVTPKLVIIDQIWSESKSHIKILINLIEKYRELVTKLDDEIQIQSTLILIIDDDSPSIREVATRQNIGIRIPYPDKIERLKLFEKLFKVMSVHTVDVSELIEITDGWNINDLKRLTIQAYIQWKTVNYAEMSKTKTEIELEDENKREKVKITEDVDGEKGHLDDEQDLHDHKANSQKGEEKKSEDLHTSKNEVKEKNSTNGLGVKLDYIIPFTIDIFKEIIRKQHITPLQTLPNNKSLQRPDMITTTNPPYLFNRGRYLTEHNKSKSIETPRSDNIHAEDDESDYALLRGSNITELNTFTVSQLYQFAAANAFDPLISSLEKIEQGRKLDELDRETLSNYPFVMKDSPKRAITKLTNAKSRVDRMKKITES